MVKVPVIAHRLCKYEIIITERKYMVWRSFLMSSSYTHTLFFFPFVSSLLFTVVLSVCLSLGEVQAAVQASALLKGQ